MERVIVNAIIALVSVPAAFLLLSSDAEPRTPIFSIGFFCTVAACVLSVLNGVAPWNPFHYLEHLCIACAGLCFAAGFWRLGRLPTDPKGGGP
jgi:hypothetical protein